MLPSREFTERHPLLSHTYRTARWITKSGLALLSMRSFDHVEYCVSEIDRAVYIVNAKAGCSSIQLSLMQRNGIDISQAYLNYQNIHTLVKSSKVFSKHPPMGHDWFYFTFVRNPFSRFVSFYLNKICDERESWRFDSYLGSLKYGASFNKVVDHVCHLPDSLSDRHFKSQFYLIMNESLKCDFVGRLEDLQSGIKLLKDRIDLSDMGIINQSKNKDLSEFFDRRSFDKIRRRYADDIREFDYDAETQHLGDLVYRTGEV